MPTGYRFRIPEIFAEAGCKNGYEFTKLVKGKISPATIYRLDNAKGRVGTIDARVLGAICTALGKTPNDVLARVRMPVSPKRK